MCPTPCHSSRPQEHARVTLADVVRAHGPSMGPVAPNQGKAMAAIAACRTASMGGHRFVCDSCSHPVVAYNSCRNRHCPQCQVLTQARWVESREADLLPVEYFHVVFTIPAELHVLFRTNAAAAYGLLFTAATQSIVTFAADPRHIGAAIGAMAVLHTWTQTLAYHPHIHMIVPGGGPSPDGTRWVASRPGFLLPVRPLAVLFRGKLLGALERSLAAGKIVAPPGHDADRALRRAARKRWCVYSKPSFTGPEHVIAYLGRYTHRIAISNHRLVAHENGQVTFRYTDRAAGIHRTMELPGPDFLRRFLAHVLPPGFVRIRYVGGLAHPTRREWLAQSRQLLADAGATLRPPAPPRAETWQEQLQRLTGVDVTRCPRCRTGRLILVERLPPERTESRDGHRDAPT